MNTDKTQAELHHVDRELDPVKMPLVSVLMTAYNREQYIAEAIESVLSSTYTNFELIIVDDCSNDRTVKIARSFERKERRVKVYINEKNLGDYANRNKAASFAKGVYIKYVDSDDILQPHALKIMVDAMERCPSAGLAFSANSADNCSEFPQIYPPLQAYRKYFYQNSLLNKGPSAAIIRTNVFVHTNGFKNVPYISDTDLWLRIAQKHQVMLLEPGLLFWREHDQQQIAYERKNSEVEKMKLENITTLLRSEDSPLSKIEADQILRNIRSIKVRSIIKGMLQGKFKSALLRFKLMNFTARDIILALRRNRKVA